MVASGRKGQGKLLKRDHNDGSSEAPDLAKKRASISRASYKETRSFPSSEEPKEVVQERGFGSHLHSCRGALLLVLEENT